jgi:hypothetical protein
MLKLKAHQLRVSAGHLRLTPLRYPNEGSLVLVFQNIFTLQLIRRVYF